MAKFRFLLANVREAYSRIKTAYLRSQLLKECMRLEDETDFVIHVNMYSSTKFIFLTVHPSPDEVDHRFPFGEVSCCYKYEEEIERAIGELRSLRLHASACAAEPCPL